MTDMVLVKIPSSVAERWAARVEELELQEDSVGLLVAKAAKAALAKAETAENAEEAEERQTMDRNEALKAAIDGKEIRAISDDAAEPWWRWSWDDGWLEPLSTGHAYLNPSCMAKRGEWEQREALVPEMEAKEPEETTLQRRLRVQTEYAIRLVGLSEQLADWKRAFDELQADARDEEERLGCNLGYFMDTDDVDSGYCAVRLFHKLAGRLLAAREELQGHMGNTVTEIANHKELAADACSD